MEPVLKAYEILWRSLVAKVFLDGDSYRVECHDKFGQKPEDCVTVRRSTLDECRAFIEKRYGRVEYVG